MNTIKNLILAVFWFAIETLVAFAGLALAIGMVYGMIYGAMNFNLLWGKVVAWYQRKTGRHTQIR